MDHNDPKVIKRVAELTERLLKLMNKMLANHPQKDFKAEKEYNQLLKELKSFGLVIRVEMIAVLKPVEITPEDDSDLPDPEPPPSMN